jgi:hypothetical protein
MGEEPALQMKHTDEKGHFSPAQSSAAKRSSTPLSERTMGQMGDKGYGGTKHGKHAFGQTHVGIGGMARMAKLKEVNKGKPRKSRVVLRGQKSDYRKAYTKGLTETTKRFKAKGLL